MLPDPEMPLNVINYPSNILYSKIKDQVQEQKIDKNLEV